ncbi:MAG: AraC family transcriptional regulator [Lachnospiraceae bacterium]
MQLTMNLHENIQRESREFPVYTYFPKYGTIYQSLPPHWHDEVEIWYCKCDGICRLDDEHIEFKKGAIIIVNKKVVHSREMLSDGSVIAILFDYKLLYFVQEDICQMEMIRPLQMEDYYLTNVILPTHEIYDAVLRNVEEIIELNEVRAFGNHLRIKARLYDILAIFFENGAYEKYDLEDIRKKAKVRAIQDSIVYMEEHLVENIAVEDLAEISKLSKFHYIRRFKDLTSYTPIQYLMNLRIEYAKVMLCEEQEMNIMEVALAAGFNHMGYFVKIFKEYVLMTPSEYRKKNK